MRLYRGNTKYKLYSGNNIKKIFLNNMVVPVEYLESTGTQYIDTNIIPDAETGIYLKSTCSNNTDTYIVGLRDTNGDTRWCIGYSSLGYYYGYGSYVAMSDRITNFTSKSYLNWMNNKKFISSDGINTVKADLSTLSFTPTNKIRLFGSSGVAASYAAWLGKIYEVKISQGSTIISDIIPVRIGSVGYMYDKTNGLLYENNGTGNFIVGPDIPLTLYDEEIDYLESTGTQYIELPCSAEVGDSFGVSGYMTPIHTHDNGYIVFSSYPLNQLTGYFYSYTNGTGGITYSSQVGELHANGGWTGYENNKTYFELSTEGRTLNGVFGTLVRPLSKNITGFSIFKASFSDNAYPIRFHSFQMKRNNTILYDLIPVRVGQVGYMYDRVSGQLFGNLGTGNFILGLDL